MWIKSGSSERTLFGRWMRFTSTSAKLNTRLPKLSAGRTRKCPMGRRSFLFCDGPSPPRKDIWRHLCPVSAARRAMHHRRFIILVALFVCAVGGLFEGARAVSRRQSQVRTLTHEIGKLPGEIATARREYDATIRELS